MRRCRCVPQRAAAVRLEEVELAVVDGELELLAGPDLHAPAHARDEPRAGVVGEEAALVGAHLLDLDRRRLDAEGDQRLVAERLDELGLDGHPRQLGIRPRPRELERARSQPEHDLATRTGERSQRREKPAKATRSSSHPAVTRFIVGDPMKAATNRLTGWWNKVCGSPNCCSTPSRMT